MEQTTGPIDTRDIDPTDAELISDWVDTAFYALSRLRSGAWRLDGTRDESTLIDIRTGIADIMRFLQPHLGGIVQALIRAHYDAGGSHRELATAMGVAQTTAQTRGDRVRHTAPPTDMELWATGEREPRTVPAADVRPGYTVIVTDQHMQVSEVRHDQTYGGVTIFSGRVSWSHPGDTEVTVVPREVPIVTDRATHTYPTGEVIELVTYRRA